MDIFRSIAVNQAQYTATAANRKAGEAEADLAMVERRMDRLALACQALWEILSERAGVTHEELSKKMAEIDVRDGTADGRITPHVVVCPACGRNVSSARPTCMFCGGPIVTDSIV